MFGDIARRSVAEDETFEQAVRCQPVGAVQAALAGFAGCIKSRQVGAASKIDQYSAAGIMLRRHDRDWSLGHVDA